MLDSDISSWYVMACDTPRQSERHTLPSGDIHTLSWGSGTKELVLLIHGALAHAECWAMVAPFLVGQDRLIVAADLSGMGDSPWLSEYSIATHTQNIIDLCQIYQNFESVTLVGHSYGGIISSCCFEKMGYSNHVNHILIDVFLDFLSPRHHINKRSPLMAKPVRYYESEAHALARFRLIPPQPTRHDELFNYLAKCSVVETDNGWRWKFDPKLLSLIGHHPDIDTERLLAHMKQQAKDVYYIYGQHTSRSLIQSAHKLMQTLGQPTHLFAVDDAYHHIMLDNPIELTHIINQILNDCRSRHFRLD